MPLHLGMDLGKVQIKKFADGEVYVQIQVRPCWLTNYN